VILSPEAIYPFLDWFVPRSLAAQHDTLRRSRIFLISHVFGPFLGHTITVYLYAIDPHPGDALAVLVGAISAFWLFPWALKCTGALTGLALMSVANLVFAILWGCYYYGGVSSPFFGWLVVVPLLAFLYLDSLLPRLVVLVMIAIGTSAFLVVVSAVGSIPEHVPLRSLSGIGTVSIVSAAVYVSMMAVYYANIVASQSELEWEMRSHRATAEMLRLAKEDAESANLAKSNFLAGMSHELRTPLNAIIGYSEMLLEEPEIEEGDQQTKQDLANINFAGKHLLMIIGDVLDLSKMEAGKMELANERFDVRSLIAEVASIAAPLCAKNANELIVEAAHELGEVQGDAARLRQMIMNLMSNAAKFSENGQIHLKAQRRSDNDGDWLELSVWDSGRGIAQENLDKLFESFTQVDPAAAAKHGGTGLGLAITKRLSHLMGGDVMVQSELGRGSCFTIRVPVSSKGRTLPGDEIASTIGAPPRILAPQRGKILVIDDDAAALDLMQRMLDKEGFTVTVTNCSTRALEVARATKPRAVVLDLCMPGLNGWDLLRALKAEKELRFLPVVILTSIDKRAEGLALGADDYLLKPADREELVRVLDRLCLDNKAELTSERAIAGT
jgi:signal transduction histidine kinase/ActR/RegA family two-component response regulator